MKLLFYVLAFITMMNAPILAQEKKEFTLLDIETNTPIVGATYNYGGQKGISTQNGKVSIIYKYGTSMHLTHISYGRWTIDDKSIKQALEDKMFLKAKETKDLYPITIIGIKSNYKQPEKVLPIEHQDRMEHDAASILDALPAFSTIRKAGNYGFDPVFRGFKYDQLNIVLNGAQSATAACPNRMDPPTSQMAPNMLERIEVIKGPYALRYGTSLGATINFVPVPLQFSDEASIYGRITSGYESNGDIARCESQLGFTGKNYDVRVFASWSQGNDYTAGNGDIVQADFKRGSFGAEIGFKLSDAQELRVSGIHNRARDSDFPALAMDLRTDDTWLFNARHDIEINKEHLKEWNSTVFGSFVDHLMDNLLKPLDPRMLNASTAAKTYNFGGRTEGIWQFEKAKLFAGMDVRIEGAEGIRTRTFLMGPNTGKVFEDNAWQDSKISKTGLFGEYQIKGNTFNYVFSGRLEINKASMDDVANEFANANTTLSTTQVNPNLSFGMLKTINNKLKLGLWLGRAQRSGSLTERFINFFPVGIDPYEMLGNPDINPEVNHQMDLNVQWRPNDKTSIDASIFGAYLTDYISSIIDPNLTPRLPTSPGVRRFINIEEAYKTGFEFNWSQKISANLQHQLGIAYTYAQDVERDEPLPEIAPLDINYRLIGNFLNDKLSTTVSIRYVADQNRNSVVFGETTTPSFTLVDVQAGYQINQGLRIETGVQNIFDENYYEHLNRSVRGTANPIFAPGRNAFVNLNYNF